MYMSKGSTSRIAGSFEVFFEGWLVRQEHYLDELVCTMQHCHESNDEDLKDLNARVLAHYQQYYEEKSRLAHRDIFLVFTPTWFSPFEKAFLWIAGFKPALLLRILHDSVRNLSDDQMRRVLCLTEETRMEEKRLDDDLARIQETVAAPPLLEMARQRGRGGGGGGGDGEEAASAMGTLMSGMEAVVANADALRTNTVLKVVDILNPLQSLTFLTAATQLQLKIRSGLLQT